MSDTLVIHPKDETTVMLEYVYKDKGFDVITDPNVSNEVLKEEIRKHDRIIMLGHGHGLGLAHPDAIHYGRPGPNGRIFIIDDTFASLFKDKLTISMWCNSDQYFIRNGLKGFHTGMIISERQEAEIFLRECPMTDEELFDNMVLLAKLLGDCIDKTPEEQKAYILSKYVGDDSITKFNRNNIRVL